MLNTNKDEILKATAKNRDDDAVMDEIRKAICSMRFGTVQVIIQDGRIVQIDRTEKIRLV
jgi:hypothetical protein